MDVETKKKDEEEEGAEENQVLSSSSSACPICLAPILDESYLDTCFHKFCYNCILQWTKVVSGKHAHKLASIKCPLCKVESFSIVHGFDGTSFQRHYINQDLKNGFVLTKAHKYRLQCYYTEPGHLSDVFNVSRYWKSRKYLQPNRWLQIWLRREIQALTQEEDVDIIVHHIHGMIISILHARSKKVKSETAEVKREEFRSLISDAAGSFLGARTEQFVTEVEVFLASGLNIEAFDAVYKQQLGWGEAPRGNEEVSGHRAVIPYLYVFDDDSDGTE